MSRFQGSFKRSNFGGGVMRIVEICRCGATIEVADQPFVTKDRYGTESVATAWTKPPWEVVSEWRVSHACRQEADDADD